MSDINVASDLVARMRHLKSRGIRHAQIGMCGHLGLDSSAEYRLLHEAFEAWPLFSGVLDYPVPHPKVAAVEAYENALDLWDTSTEYGANRWALLDHCIEYLERHYD